MACGPVGDDPAVFADLEPGQTERIARTALDEPDRNAAIRFLHAVLPETDKELPGVRNVGMFATHELRHGVPARPDWTDACQQGHRLLTSAGRGLVEGLGFAIESHGTTTSILKAGSRKRAVAVFLEDRETPEGPTDRFSGLSPVSHGLAAADEEDLPYVVVTRGKQIRVYAARKDVGVGRKGRAETFIEINLALLPDASAGYLPLMFGAEALQSGGTFEQILDRSGDFAADLGARLRERVYRDVVPALAKAVVAHHTGGRAATEEELAFLYEEALVILFRLLFIAYAEDKDLLPYRSNGLYRHNALKTRARDLADRANAGNLTFDSTASDLWVDLQKLFRAVEKGHAEWDVPAYGGELFSSEADVSDIGSELAELELTNDQFGTALLGLLVDRAADGSFGAVDFRSLSVREFGTIYEGLLESSLSVALSDLTLDSEDHFVPVTVPEEIKVKAGEIYLHNRSGARKATGSYFTKPFAVEHLLDRALEPALDEHIERLERLIEAGEEHDTAEAFFDFRCADIAMGSGHFLVAAVDRIEARLSRFLARHSVPEITAELDRLLQAAEQALGPLAEGVEIEHASLLRRQVARRCIYGVDVNSTAVELARLAIWIHTFVPGLPLSFLDHNLVQGNSLTGLGSLREAVAVLEPTVTSEEETQVSFYYDGIVDWLLNARDALLRLARISEASMKEIAEAREAQQAAERAVEPAAQLFDLLVGVRLREIEPFTGLSEEAIATHEKLSRAEELVGEFDIRRFPILFPEVFIGDHPGFDCIVGNPPWDKVRFEAQQFWVTREPGLNALSQRDRTKAIEHLRESRPTDAAIEAQEEAERQRLQELFEVSYQHLGRGHYDLAKIFVERALDLLSDRGRLGYVLPRQCLVLGGWSDLREQLVVDHVVEAVQTRNRGGWLFEDVDHRYMVVLISRGFQGDGEAAGVRIWPAITSLTQFFSLSSIASLFLSEAELEELSDNLVIPWFNGAKDIAVFDVMRRSPRLGSGAGWIQGVSETRWDFSGSGRHHSLAGGSAEPGAWRVLMSRHVMQFQIGASGFQRFVPDPSSLVPLNLGVHADRDRVLLGHEHPAIVFRYPSRNDDARTMIAAALEESGLLPSTGYVHAIRHAQLPGQEKTLALLGYLNSYTCDWWVRRFVDRHVTAPVVNNIPLPQWSEGELAAVAALATELVVRRGTRHLPGGSETSARPEFSSLSDHELLRRIESHVLRGFALSNADLRVVLEDFSENGCPPELRRLLLEEDP